MGNLPLLPALVSAVIAFGANFVWFTIVFRAPYLAGLGKSQADLDRGPSIVVASALQLAGFFIMALVLGWLIQRTGHGSLAGGLKVALIAWLGFVAAIMVPMHAFQAYPATFTAINAGGYLVALLIAGAVIGAWR